MSNNARGLKQLFSDSVLAAAAEADQPRAASELSDERLLQALRGEQPFNAAERRLVLSSVATRERLYALRKLDQVSQEHARAEAEESRRQAEDINRQWTKRGWLDALMVVLAAADSAPEIKPIVIEIKLCTVEFFPIDAAGHTWRINVRIAKDKLDRLSAMSPHGVRLLDGKGETLVQDFPDNDGLIVGFWEREQDFRERLKQGSLRLEPITEPGAEPLDETPTDPEAEQE